MDNFLHVNIMKFEVNDNKTIITIFERVSEVMDEVRLEYDSDGVRCRALSRSHVEFVQFDLQSSFFTEYNVDTPDAICVDLSELNKVLKRCKNNDTLSMSVDEGNLIVTFSGDSTRTFNIRLIDLEYESPNAPVLDLPVTLDMDSDVLADMLDDALLFSESARFTVDEDYLYCHGEGDFGDTTSKYIHGEQITESVASTFNIPSLKGMLKTKSLAKNCTLRLGENQPLLLTFNVDDGVLEFMIAPRIETDY